MTRVSLYWHNGRSLGHTMETALLARALLDQDPATSIAGLSGAVHGLDAFPTEVDVLRLPGYLNFDRPGPDNLVPKLQISRRQLFALRAELIAVHMAHVRPHVFVVNHIPEGLEGELGTALREHRYHRGVLTLRGILFGPEQTRREYFGPEPAAWIAEHFDEIHVHTDPAVFRLEDAYEVPTELADRVRYTGYMREPDRRTPEEARRALGIAPDGPLVVIAMGGGQGSGDILGAWVAACAAGRTHLGRVRVVTGPYLEPAAYAELVRASDAVPEVDVVAYEPDLLTWMRASDLFIGAGGANMLGEVLATQANAVIVPRQRREPEQEMHTGRLAALGLVRSIDREAIVADGGDLVEEALARPLGLAPDAVQMGGARASAAAIAALAG